MAAGACQCGHSWKRHDDTGCQRLNTESDDLYRCHCRTFRPTRLPWWMRWWCGSEDRLASARDHDET